MFPIWQPVSLCGGQGICAVGYLVNGDFEIAFWLFVATICAVFARHSSADPVYVRVAASLGAAWLTFLAIGRTTGLF
jgi:hypothetical protein